MASDASPVPPEEALANVENILDQIEQALTRLDDGTTGSAERVRSAIDDDQLEAAPTAAGLRILHAGGCLNTERRPRGPAGRRGPTYFLVSQKILSISAIWASSSSATLTSVLFFTSPAFFVAFQKMSWSCGNFSRCSGLK